MADSRNAFEGNSLSSSTPSSRQTPDSSWTESSRRESASCHDNETMGSSRPAGGQEDAEATSSGHIEVSCTDEILSITIKDANMLATHYRLKVLMPSEQCKSHLPARGYVTVSKSFLKFGVRFLLHQFFKDVLRYYGLTVFQVMSNG